ncbi:hypothetical protein [Spirosoma endophyticum]|uniref:hypothetical protein n=1 Tax=Spirosoma endophyticum TaxID=662367 RepID=UPI0015A5AD2C|nr:hypothetical protein [Spirosoma endophyticum]
MVYTIRTVQAIFGLVILVIMVGWCLWRLACWTGLIARKIIKRKPSEKPGNAPVGKGPKKSPGNLSKQAYYCAKRHN